MLCEQAGTPQYVMQPTKTRITEICEFAKRIRFTNRMFPVSA